MENGQARMSALDHLDYCCRLVSEMYGKPDVGSWTNGDFIRLGYILYKKTNVQISPNTLKRIFGKIKTDLRYYPQKATRDALAKYVGYTSWEAFISADAGPGHRTEQKVQIPVTVNVDIQGKPENSAPPESKKINIRRAAPAVLALILTALFFVYKAFFTAAVPVAAKLICQNPVGENPHSAAFVVRGIAAVEDPNAHYTIDFGDGRKVTLVAADSLYSHYYEVPGRYWAVLKNNGVVIDTASVYLKTNGWTATAEMMYDTTRVYPIEVSNLLSSGKKTVSAAEVSKAGVDTNRTFFVKFINTQVTGISGDNFDLLVKLNTSAPRPGVRCSQVRLTVLGESSKHFFDVMKTGCTHWTDMQFSEIEKPGESNQLSFLGADLHQGGLLELKVADRHARVFINSKQVFEADYHKPLNQIYGLGIAFSGIGAIQSVLLKDSKTGKVFDGNFQ